MTPLVSCTRSHSWAGGRAWPAPHGRAARGPMGGDGRGRGAPGETVNGHPVARWRHAGEAASAIVVLDGRPPAHTAYYCVYSVHCTPTTAVLGAHALHHQGPAPPLQCFARFCIYPVRGAPAGTQAHKHTRSVAAWLLLLLPAAAPSCSLGPHLSRGKVEVVSVDVPRRKGVRAGVHACGMGRGWGWYVRLLSIAGCRLPTTPDARARQRGSGYVAHAGSSRGGGGRPGPAASNPPHSRFHACRG